MTSLRCALLALLLSPAAHAAVQQSSADGFLIGFSEPVTATPAKVWTDLVQVQRWWSDEHTFSAKAANLSLAPTAGGCFCERWADGSVEHARVVMALPHRLLRLDGALGPLQELALKGTLNFWIRSDEDGTTRLDVEYRVNGAAGSGLDAFAPQVDAMLAEQVARLTRFITSGHAEAPPVHATAAEPDRDTQRALLQAWAASAAAANAGAASHPRTAKPPAPKPKSAQPKDAHDR